MQYINIRYSLPALHAFVCLASIIAVYLFRNHTLLSMVFSELIIIYVAVVNYKRREIIPPLAICLFFKLIEYPVSLWQFSNVPVFLGTLILFDVALFFCLAKFYRADFMWRLFRIDVPQLPIPQVKAICTLILIGVFHLALIFSEVSVHLLGIVEFDDVPFFYRTFPEVRATLKVALMLGIWSMMLDSYYHPMRRAI